MRSKSEQWLLGLGLAYVLVMPVMISAAVGWHDMPIFIQRMSSTKAAAWAQVIGSLLAIVATATIAGRQSRIAEQERKRAAYEFAELMAHLARRSVEMMSMAFEEAIDQDLPEGFLLANFDAIARALTSAELTRMPKASLMTEVVELQRNLQFFQRRYSEWTQGSPGSQKRATAAGQMRDIYADAKTRCMEIDRIVGSIGRDGGFA